MRFFVSIDLEINSPRFFSTKADSVCVLQAQSDNWRLHIDPVNFVDPTGLLPSVCGVEFSYVDCGGSAGFWGGGEGFGGDIAEMNREFGGMPPNIGSGIQRHNENLNNALGSNGYRTNEEVSQDIRII